MISGASDKIMEADEVLAQATCHTHGKPTAWVRSHSDRCSHASVATRHASNPPNKIEDAYRFRNTRAKCLRRPRQSI